MYDIRFLDSFPVDLVQSVGSDKMICLAARVSTLGEDSLGGEESAGLINFLMRGRHGTPFEHGSMTFRIKAPIFVWREFMRHRIGFSYNEQSGRYMELSGDFYLPSSDRPLIQQGKPGAYSFIPGDDVDYNFTESSLSDAYRVAWEMYRTMLDNGIAMEVARMCLPVATYSSAYVTCNPRSLMAFLSLRTKSEASMFPSYPQWEIQQVARAMEDLFAQEYPLTWESFEKNGRVAP